MARKNSVYFIQETVRDDNNEFIPCIAIENERGYNRTDWHWGTDKELAQECCDEKNKVLGFTPKEAMLIQLSTMRGMGIGE